MIKIPSNLVCGFALILATAAPGTPPAGAVTMNARATVPFAPYRDPWPAARERWWDIDNDQYNDWVSNGAPNGRFSYSVNPQVTLTYDSAPGVPYFVGHIDATGLKPNFCYQLKLVGKPVYGSRGMRTSSSYVDFAGTRHRVGDTPVNGDDWANERIGYAGRWWDDTNQTSGTNLEDSYYVDYYKNPVLTGRPAPSSPAIHTVYGYHFMGSFVTNARGEAHVDFTGRYSYHIDWASWQGGAQDAFHGAFPVRGFLSNSNPTRYYGYGATAPSTSVSLYYEYEFLPPHNLVNLPAGTYHCRFLLTEESFHNSPFATPLGGYWKSVLATEDFTASGQPDTSAANDVVFTIGRPAPTPQPAPVISGFSPTSGPLATVVTITGSNLQEVTAVKLGLVAAAFTRISATELHTRVPAGAITGRLSVTTAGGTAISGANFIVSPTLGSFAPVRGPVGTVVTITGNALNGASAVRFGGASSSFTRVSATLLRAVVPAAAVSGPLTVTTPAGTATSATSFTVTPRIISFTPDSGANGTVVTITGSSLTGTRAVSFNGKSAIFQVLSSAQVRATVPVGATSGRISITTGDGTATSVGSFTTLPG